MLIYFNSVGVASLDGEFGGTAPLCQSQQSGRIAASLVFSGYFQRNDCIVLTTHITDQVLSFSVDEEPSEGVAVTAGVSQHIVMRLETVDSFLTVRL